MLIVCLKNRALTNTGAKIRRINGTTKHLRLLFHVNVLYSVNVTIIEKYKEKQVFLWYFARFTLSLSFARRYFRSEMKIKHILFCISLTYS
jgi:hypothetical protein